MSTEAHDSFYWQGQITELEKKIKEEKSSRSSGVKVLIFGIVLVLVNILLWHGAFGIHFYSIWLIGITALAVIGGIVMIAMGADQKKLAELQAELDQARASLAQADGPR